MRNGPARKVARVMNWSDSGLPPGAGPGVVVTATSRAGLLHDLERRMQAGTGYAVATLNLDHVVKLHRQPDFRRAYLGHSHVTADGNPIVWLSRLAGQQVALIPGSDLIEPVAALAARLNIPVALVGSQDATLARAGAALQARHPGLRVVARIAPPMGFDPEGPEADACIATLRDAGARLCFLAFGAPKQERFAVRAWSEMPEAGFLSIGAGLDFIVGDQKRAPAVIRALALEWAWRLVHSPRRLGGRYASCIALLPRLTARALQSRLAGRKEAGL